MKQNTIKTILDIEGFEKTDLNNLDYELKKFLLKWTKQQNKKIKYLFVKENKTLKLEDKYWEFFIIDKENKTYYLEFFLLDILPF